MQASFPRHGPLSGMILPAVAGAMAIALGVFAPDAIPTLSTPIPEAVVDALALTVGWMVLHKVESYFAREWDRCPVYLTQTHTGGAEDPGRMLFMGFVPAVCGAFVLFVLVLRGAPWPGLLLGIWMAQGLHEWHHAAKSLVERKYYPGTVTGLIFAATMSLSMFPVWAEWVAPGNTALTTAWYVAQPIVFLLFVREHSRWYPRYLDWRMAVTNTSAASSSRQVAGAH